MENIMQMLLNETTLWAPRVGGVVLIILVFFILSKFIRREFSNRNKSTYQHIKDIPKPSKEVEQQRGAFKKRYDSEDPLKVIEEAFSHDMDLEQDC
jgi:Na+-transporting methylmalonyl-CoA/oxaloacetate decarboxylase gamma subunit